MLLPPRLLFVSKMQSRCAAPCVSVVRRAVVPDARAGLLPVAMALSCLLCLSCRLAWAQRGAASQMSQRSINEMAAGVEQARRILLDDAHLRRPGEDLSAYLRRAALPLPAETKQQYFARASAYVAALGESAAATRAGRRMPALRDTDAFNQEQWTRAVRALQILPARALKTQAAWRRVQAGSDVFGLSTSNISHANVFNAPQSAQMQFAAQMEQTVQVVIAADDALRNAKP